MMTHPNLINLIPPAGGLIQLLHLLAHSLAHSLARSLRPAHIRWAEAWLKP